MTPEDRPADLLDTGSGDARNGDARRLAARLLDALGDLDLTSADGRAGISTLLSAIEHACPGAILRQAAGIELRRVGWPGAQAASRRAASDSAPTLHDAA